MGLNREDFERFVLFPTLQLLAPEVPYTANGNAITLETIWHESAGLTYLGQKGDGPARGLGQCERPTFAWLTREWLPREMPLLWAKFGSISAHWPAVQFDELTWNLRLAVALVRCRYLPDPHAIPGTVESRAAYWGRVYQTTNDPVKMQQYVDSARRLA